MQRRTVGLIVVGVLSCAFLLVGLVMMLTPLTQTASFGWAAYQPLSSTMLISGSNTAVDPTALAGMFFAGAGLLGIGGVIGFLIAGRVFGRRGGATDVGGAS